MNNPKQLLQLVNILISICVISILKPFPCSALSMSTNFRVQGSAAKPYEKKKVAVFGGGGYLGGLVFGFLQRAGSLYGTGIQGVGAPRCIVSTAFGSQSLNGILSKQFILAQADESFVKLTDMSSLKSIQDRITGFDAVVMGTQYTLEQRPVTAGTYESTPNDKTMEFYFDTRRSSVVTGKVDPIFSANLLERSLEACRLAGVKHIVVVETDSSFEEASDNVGDYIEKLKASNVPFTYIRPLAKLENIQDYDYAKGVQGNLQISAVDSGNGQGERNSPLPIPREDIAALCVQSLLSMDWKSSRLLCVSCSGPVMPISNVPEKLSKQWCANADALAAKLAAL